MTIPAETQAQIDQLTAKVAELTAQNTQLVDAQVSAAMQTRDAQAMALCEKYQLPADEIEINFSEPGQESKKVKTTWKPFLVSLSEEQFQAFSGLAGGLKKSESGDAGGLMFSEFDKPDNRGTVELSAADTGKLNDRLKEARKRAITAYSTGL